MNESIIYDIFGGLLNQRITCHKCHNVSITKQEFYDLSLGLNKKKIKSNNNGDNITNDSNKDDTTSTTATSTSTSDPIFNSNKFSVEKSINDFFSNEVIKNWKMIVNQVISVRNVIDSLMPIKYLPLKLLQKL